MRIFAIQIFDKDSRTICQSKTIYAGTLQIHFMKLLRKWTLNLSAITRGASSMLIAFSEVHFECIPKFGAFHTSQPRRKCVLLQNGKSLNLIRRAKIVCEN
jgi:hypothetical protein